MICTRKNSSHLRSYLFACRQSMRICLRQTVEEHRPPTATDQPGFIWRLGVRQCPNKQPVILKSRAPSRPFMANGADHNRQTDTNSSIIIESQRRCFRLVCRSFPHYFGIIPYLTGDKCLPLSTRPQNPTNGRVSSQ